MRELYELQRELNEEFFALFPDKPKTEEEVLLALTAELGELLNELKPVWAWWKPNGAYNHSRALEEAADVLFFALTLDLVRGVIPSRLNITQPLFVSERAALRYLMDAHKEAHFYDDGVPVAPYFLQALLHLWDYEALKDAYMRKWYINKARIAQTANV